MRRRATLLALNLLLIGSPALGQTATGVGVANSKSQSQSAAVAISGQSNVTISNPANTTSTSTIRQEVSGTQTLKNAPTAFAPSLAAAGLETCLGSVSGGGSIVGFGGSFGTTVPDPGCQARLDARTLWSFGLKGAAVARLCVRDEIYRSMPDVCAKYLPQVQPQPVAAPYYLFASPTANVQTAPIEVVEGTTGKTRMCDNYDAALQRCRAWTGTKRMARVNKPKPLAAAPAAVKPPEADSGY